MNTNPLSMKHLPFQVKAIPHAVPHEIANTLSSCQHQYLEKFITSYTERTHTSKQTAQVHRSVLSDNKTFVGFNHLLKELFYPLVAQRSRGSRVWDVDGNEYIDGIMGFGINLFGHNPPFIKAALEEQLEKGFALGPQSEFAGEVAEMIGELTGMERVAFSNTGTEAVMTAIRLARAATNRHKIALFSGSYHGHFDGTLAKVQITNGDRQTVPMSPGVLPQVVNDVLVLDYGNPDSLEAIDAHQHELAAVLVEPVQTSRLDLQPKAFLQQLRHLTETADIALIFDELVTGFRIHPGGAQAWFDLKADIATYGKIVGGGLPIGVIAGKAMYLDQIDGGMWNYGDSSFPDAKTTFFAGTFCKHPLAIAAARVVLKHLKLQGNALQHRLNQRTAQFVNTLNAYFEDEKLPIRMTHFGSLFGPASSGQFAAMQTPAASTQLDVSTQLDLLYYHLIHKGILLRGNGGFLSTAHTDDDLESMIQAVQDSVTDLRSGGFLSF